MKNSHEDEVDSFNLQVAELRKTEADLLYQLKEKEKVLTSSIKPKLK